MLCGASHNCSESQQIGLQKTSSPRNQHCFLSHSTFQFEKKKFLFVMNRGEFSVGIFVKN